MAGVDIRVICEKEQKNNDRIYAYKEGVFWRVYEISAYSLYKVIQTLKPLKYKVKELHDGILYMSIDAADINKICKKLSVVRKADDFLEYSVPWVSKEEYDLWKYNFIMKNNNSLSCERQKDTSSYLKSNDNIFKKEIKEVNEEMKNIYNFDVGLLINEIKTFPVEMKTPLECMNWIGEIKRIVNN